MKLVVKQDPVYRRRRAVALGAAVLVLGLLVLALAKACAPDAGPAPPARGAVPATRLVERTVVRGAIRPRALAAARGTVLAANMMYRHSVTAYDAAGTLVATIPDAVRLADLGVFGHDGVSRGAPAGVALTADGRRAYVTNYSMTGAGFGPEPSDSCATDPKAPGSFVYRLDVAARRVDQAISVGAVPRDVALTPDGRTALVASWCAGEVAVIDTASGKATARVAVGLHPRGLAVARDGRTAYVLTGPTNAAGELHALDLARREQRVVATVGVDPRQVAVDVDGTLLVACAGDSTVRRVGTDGRALAQVGVPAGPRGIAVAPDGASVYVVSYDAARLTALRGDDLRVRSQVATPPSPVGVVVEPTRRAVWVAGYGGAIGIYDEAAGTSSAAAPTTR